MNCSQCTNQALQGKVFCDICGADLRTLTEEASGKTVFSASMTLTASGQQDQGWIRQHQEDTYLLHLLPGCSAALLVIADGMGGHRAGDVASQAAAQTAAQVLLPILAALRPSETLRLPASDSPDESLAIQSKETTQDLDTFAVRMEKRPQWHQVLNQAMHQAQQAVRSKAAQVGAADNAGTTLTIALIVGQTLHLAHIGDSRVYLWRQSQLRQLTMDHSGAAALVSAGLISPSAARAHPATHQLYRYLGGEPRAARPDIFQMRLQGGDLLLLCSDGLWGMVEDTALAGLLTGASDLSATLQQLVDAANAAGGEDNISAILARLTVEEQE